MSKKTIIALMLACFFCLNSFCGNNDKQDGVYRNPVIALSNPDPTVIRAKDGYFYLYATEDTRNTPIYKSKDLVNWDFVGTAFTDATHPTMVKGGGVWAPDINYINGKYVLYYAMSTWGGEWTCGIGVATADKPTGPFHDLGALFTSKSVNVQNSIDEFFIKDHGKNYMFWGSFHGIYGIELTKDGLKVKEGAKPKKIAGDFMEGTLIFKKNGYYYLLGSNGTCCEGAKSTYKVTVGRSKDIFGPYVTKEGGKLLDNKYDVILHSSDFVAGPGHNAEIITDDAGHDWMLYHGYLRQDPDRGRCVFLDRMYWKDGWPYFLGDVPSQTHEKPVFKNK